MRSSLQKFVQKGEVYATIAYGVIKYIIILS